MKTKNSLLDSILMKPKLLGLFLVGTLLAFCLAAPPPAQATDINNVGGLIGTQTNIIGAGTTSTTFTATSGAIITTRTKDVWLGGTVKYMAASTSNFNFSLSASVDGALWITNYQVITVAGNGTNPIYWLQPITNAPPFLMLGSISNTHATVVGTNLVFKATTRSGF